MTHIICPPKTLFHCLTHFQSIDASSRRTLNEAGYTDAQIDEQLGKPGSKFHHEFARSVEGLMDRLRACRPDLFLDDACIPCDADGKAVVSVVFPYQIGTSGIALVEELSEDELSTMTTESRNGFTVRKAYVRSLSETDECQVIIRKGRGSWHILTVYPGEYAPPLPRSGESDPYWDVHCFVEERREA